MKKIESHIILFIALLVFSAYAKAGPVRLRLPDTTATERDTVTLPVFVDSPLTDSNVVAYQLEISFSSYYLEAIDIVRSGTMSEGWSDIEYDLPEDGRIRIAAAGTTPLAGTGELIRIRFYVKRPGGSYLNFYPEEANFFNEGQPILLLDNGYVTLFALPVITVSPNDALLTSG